MRITRLARIGLPLLAMLASGGCWNRIEVHPAPVAADGDPVGETRVLGWAADEPGTSEVGPEPGVVAQVEDGERTFHVLVGEDASGRPWSAAFSLDD